MSENQHGLSEALKALATATADLTKAATIGLGKDVAVQVAEALQSAAVAVEGAAKKVSPSAKSNTRADILEAAGAVFAEKGFDSSSLDEIAKRAGRTKGAIYAHFQSKDELMLALAKSAFEECELDKGSQEVIIAYKEGRLAELIDDINAAPGQGQSFLLSLEIVTYALRHPEHKQEIGDSFAKSSAQLEHFLHAQIPGIPPNAALTFATIVNLGSIYAALSPKLATGSTIVRALDSAFGRRGRK